MRIYITSIFVDDQAKACAFYTGKLGFQVKHDIPLGKYRWLTLTASDDPEGTELLLEPSDHAAVPPFKTALMADGIPGASFQVDNLDAEFRRLRELGVEFMQAPAAEGEVKTAVLNDTCGNLVQLVEMPKE
ncbi:MAG: VOC family protein [Spirochaetaceae bacterium]|nr:VOC family protein [Spirochaetaceae bacterium]